MRPHKLILSTRIQIQQTLLHQINCPTSTKQSSFVSAHRALFLPIGGKEHIERSICEHEPEYDYIIIAWLWCFTFILISHGQWSWLSCEVCCQQFETNEQENAKPPLTLLIDLNLCLYGLEKTSYQPWVSLGFWVTFYYRPVTSTSVCIWFMQIWFITK